MTSPYVSIVVLVLLLVLAVLGGFRYSRH